MTPEERAALAAGLAKIDAGSAELHALLAGGSEPPPPPPPELPEDESLASRTVGVAPLCVLFDCGSQVDDFLRGACEWDFGDPESGTWPNGRSKATEFGPIVGHVFERPGTYKVKLLGRAQVSITVLDPNDVFAGDKTICFSRTGDFFGAPAGAQLVTTSSLGHAASFLAPGRRLLFARSETWEGGVASFGGELAGPGVIGAFGAGTRPVIRTAVTLFAPRWTDWRVQNLIVEGAAAGSRAFRAAGYCKQVLIHRSSALGVKSAWHFSTSQLPASGPLYDECAVVECMAFNLVGGQGGNGSMFAGRRALFLGNEYENMEGVEHCARFPWLQGAAILHNRLARPATSKHVIKLHGPVFSGEQAGLGAGQYTERVYVAHNLLEGGQSSWPFASGPEDDHTDQRVRQIRIQGNRIKAGPRLQVGFFLSGQDIVAEDNIVDGSGSAESDGLTAFWVARRGIEPPPKAVEIWHNTAWTPEPDRFVFCRVVSSATDVSLQGNLASAPAATSKTLLSGPGIDGGNLLHDSPGFRDPAAGDFSIVAGGAGEGYGAWS